MNPFRNAFALTIAAPLLISGCVTTQGGGSAGWNCIANGLVNAHYTGGDYAVVQLQGFSSGNSYKVSKTPDGTEARGVTGNGTPFVCKATR